MIIAVDVDNVINNLQTAVIDIFNERYITNYTLDNFTDYNVENILPIQEAVAMKKLYGDTNIYSYVKPITGSQDAIQKLINEGHQIYLVTKAIPKNYNEKINWIKHFFPFVDESHIIAMEHKHLFRCDCMIEDNINNLLAGVSYHRICLNYPWNKNIRDYVYSIYRCNNWNEILNIINKLDKEE